MMIYKMIQDLVIKTLSIENPILFDQNFPWTKKHTFHTVYGWNPKPPPGMYETL